MRQPYTYRIETLVTGKWETYTYSHSLAQVFVWQMNLEYCKGIAARIVEVLP